MCDYTLEGGHFAEDEEEDEDSSNGDNPEKRRELLWCGHWLLPGFYERYSEATVMNLASRLT